VLEALGEVYRVDAQAKDQAMTPEQRLVHHQTHSQPVIVPVHDILGENYRDSEGANGSGLSR
jgi:hypothetical protein